MAIRWKSWMLVTVVATLALGCSRGSGVATTAVSGTITYKGEPVVGATVGFVSPSQARPAVGTTDAQGKYQLTTTSPNDGAPVGSYTVTVSKSKVSTGGEGMTAAGQSGGAVQPSDSYAKFMKGASQKSAAKPKTTDVGEGGIPEKYASPGSSDLKAEVTTSGPNKFDFELK